jgi:multiple antibiotic resistance protein
MTELFLAAFVAFFVVINPAGVAVTFATLTEGADSGWRRLMAVRAVVVATLVLGGFAFGGEWLLAQLGVSLDSFRIAGGALLFLIAVDMLFERRKERRDATAESVSAARARGEQDDISVFPLAIPLISGPGAIATVMLYFTEHESPTGRLVVLGAAGANLILTLLAFLLTRPLTRLMGATVLMVITRIFGIILAALAAQFVVDGVSGAFELGVAQHAFQGR